MRQFQMYAILFDGRVCSALISQHLKYPHDELKDGYGLIKGQKYILIKIERSGLQLQGGGQNLDLQILPT